MHGERVTGLRGNGSRAHGFWHAFLRAIPRPGFDGLDQGGNGLQRVKGTHCQGGPSNPLRRLNPWISFLVGVFPITNFDNVGLQSQFLRTSGIWQEPRKGVKYVH